MEGKQLGELLLDDLLVVEDCAHVGPECIYILAQGDPMLLGLIPESIEPGSEVLNLVLDGRRRTGDIWLSGRDGRWMGGVDGGSISPKVSSCMPNKVWYAIISSSSEGS